MIRRSTATLVLLVLAATVAVAQPSSPRPPDAPELAAHVGALTAPDMEGRGSGTPGGELAARYIGDHLAAAGLRPGGESGTFFQPFVVGASIRSSPRSTIERIGAAPATLVVGRDWMPHGGSRTGEVTGPVVSVGHGIVADDGSHDDYATVDARGKIALALDGAPAGRTDLRQTRLDKLITARRHGAIALLIAAGALPSAAATASAVDIVSGTVTEAAARVLAPGSRVQIRVELEREERHAFNVVGVLPGSDPARVSEAIVIGAHYDHLGRVGGIVHPGADDNASGTALVLGLARSFAAVGGVARTLVFALFSGEEMGLIGSSHYVTSPVVPLERTVAMLNFDMVGRLRERRLRVGGIDTGGGLRAVAAEAGRSLPLDVELEGSPFSPSDHHRFYTAGVPVLFFHTGTHADYHRPTDLADRIDAAGMAHVAALAVRVVERLASQPRPVYAKVSPPAPGRRNEPAVGAFFGISPELDEAADGLRLRSVVEGSAAARAGMRDVDIIVRMAGVPIESFDDLRSVIRARRPGDTVSVVYLRGGQDHSTAATLGAWPAP